MEEYILNIIYNSNSIKMISKTVGLLLATCIITVKGFSPSLMSNKNAHSSTFKLQSTTNNEKGEGKTSSRRDFVTIAGSSAFAAATLFSQSQPSVAAVNGNYSDEKVLVLGGTGFVGSEVCKQLQALGIEYVATSRDGRGGTKALDFTNPSLNVPSEVESLTKSFTAVISCIGAIGTSNDEVVNSGTGLAALGAKASGVKKIVYISVAPEVRDAAKGVSFLEKYMTGKKFSEDTIKSNFEGGYTLIEPTFIYGGDKFAINPPRVADGYGKLVEGLLSSGPFRAAASISPGIIGVALEPPVKVSSVAGAAVSAALGLTQSTLDTYDKINDAAKLI